MQQKTCNGRKQELKYKLPPGTQFIKPELRSLPEVSHRPSLSLLPFYAHCPPPSSLLFLAVAAMDNGSIVSSPCKVDEHDVKTLHSGTRTRTSRCPAITSSCYIPLEFGTPTLIPHLWVNGKHKGRKEKAKREREGEERGDRSRQG
ncbi:hypothetical protein E2542_SST13542 [Spatholobus suberectus]|nr:hypothetical protein E2542_SST13542 [Spatholobus suberectus]